MASESLSLSADGPVDLFSQTQIRHLMRVEFSRAQRYDYALTCCVIGADDLEALRDRHGYDFKSAILDEVTALFVRTTRSCDYLGRLLDDRLMAVLPHTDRSGAEAGGKRVVEAARELGFEANGERIPVTVSVGVATYENENTMFFDSLVEAAEGAVREAADAGGDRVVYRDPGPSGG